MPVVLGKDDRLKTCRTGLLLLVRHIPPETAGLPAARMAGYVPPRTAAEHAAKMAALRRVWKPAVLESSGTLNLRTDFQSLTCPRTLARRRLPEAPR